MNNKKKLTIIITPLVICVIFALGIVYLKCGDKQSMEESQTAKTTASDATLLDATSLDATSLNATSSDGADNSLATETDVNQLQVGTDTDVKGSTLETTTEEEEEEKALPPAVSLELELIYQHPELPTGCESVALTMLLNYYGFELDKTTIAREYLIYADNFVAGFVGNPFSSNGAGIYSPGLTKTANKFLNAQGSDLNAKNVTDSTPEELYRYLAEGKPVVIWNTVYFLPNQPTGQIVKWGEKEYHWDRCEHCMVLSGYDLEQNVVIVHDPIQGIIERDADAFWEKYESLGSMALIIR